MKAILLLGGYGTRLRPLTDSTPKQMLPICGRPMIEWVCEHLHRHGIDHVVLALGYRSEAFTTAYPRGRIGRLSYDVAVEPEARGTAGAVRFAAEAAGVAGTFLVLNGDVLTDLDIGDLVAQHERSGAEATIALQPVADPTPYGLVTTDPSGRVLSFSEKPQPGSVTASSAEGGRPTISSGTYVLTSATLDRVVPDRPVSIEREIFPRIVEDRALAALVADVYWLDTGTPRQYLAANLDVLEGRRANAQVVDGLAAASADIHPEAHVRTSVIGEGCEIGPGVVVQRSVLGPRCRLAAGVTVIDSLLGADAVVGPEAVLREYTVVGHGEHIGAGAVLRQQRRPHPER